MFNYPFNKILHKSCTRSECMYINAVQTKYQRIVSRVTMRLCCTFLFICVTASCKERLVVISSKHASNDFAQGRCMTQAMISLYEIQITKRRITDNTWNFITKIALMHLFVHIHLRKHEDLSCGLGIFNESSWFCRCKCTKKYSLTTNTDFHQII
jgi:hypothetical protein